jgi:hemin uptake protein HemP
MSSPTDARDSLPPPASQPREGAQSIESQAILQGRSCVTITHKGVAYRLQETRAGKLILTK